MQIITIPDRETTNRMHGTPTVVGVCLDADGNVVKKFEKPPKENVFAPDIVDKIKILGDRSLLKNNPVNPKYRSGIDLRSKGLREVKDIKIEEIKDRAYEVLSETDWYITRKQETGEAIPQDVLDHRSQVRSDSDSFEQEVNNLESVEDVLNYEYSYSEPRGV